MIPGLSLPVPCSSRLAPLWKQCWRQLSPCLWWLHSSVSTGMLSTSFSNGDGTSLADITYSDLRRARSSVIRQSGRLAPGKGSFDTMTPMVKLGLEVVEFDVLDTMQFVREIAEKN